MRLLYINHPESDYGGAFIYLGLCKMFGEENVFDLPIKHSYHGLTHKYSTQHIEHGLTCAYPWADPTKYAWPYPEMKEEGLLQYVRTLLAGGEFDFVFVESMRTTALRVLRSLYRDIQAAGLQIIMHDGEDGKQIEKRLLEEFKPRYLLKRELPRANEGSDIKVGGTSIIGFPFSFPVTTQTSCECVSFTEFKNRMYAASMLFGATSKERFDIVSEFRRSRGSFDMPVFAVISPDNTHLETHGQEMQPWFKYMVQFRDSLLGVSAIGFGEDTCRYWEIPSCTAMLCNEPDMCIPFSFKHGHTCLVYNSPKQAVELALRYSREDYVGELYEIYAAGYEWLHKYHTNEARCRWLMERVLTDM